MSVFPYYEFDRPFQMMEKMEKDFCRRNFLDFPTYPFHQSRDLFNDYSNKSWDSIVPWKDVFRPWDNVLRPFDSLTSAMNQLSVQGIDGSSITSDKDKFQINVDVQHFAPEEISVTIKDKEVMVEGKHEEKRDDHGYISRQFSRRYTLPGECLPDTVQSSLSSDGVLTVTAPKVLALPSSGERIVPITHTGPAMQLRNDSQVTENQTTAVKGVK